MFLVQWEVGPPFTPPAATHHLIKKHPSPPLSHDPSSRLYHTHLPLLRHPWLRPPLPPFFAAPSSLYTLFPIYTPLVVPTPVPR